jgi:hypothetical protein
MEVLLPSMYSRLHYSVDSFLNQSAKPSYETLGMVLGNLKCSYGLGPPPALLKSAKETGESQYRKCGGLWKLDDNFQSANRFPLMSIVSKPVFEINFYTTMKGRQAILFPEFVIGILLATDEPKLKASGA